MPSVKDELAVLQRRTAVELTTETRITFALCYALALVFPLCFIVITNQLHLIFGYHLCLYYQNQVSIDTLDNCL